VLLTLRIEWHYAARRTLGAVMTAPLPCTVAGWLPRLWQEALFPAAVIPVLRWQWLNVLLVLAMPGALLYPTLGFHLLEPDEGRYAQIPREMLLNQEWVVPTLQGEAYLDKPPLFYWLVKLSYSAFGVNEAAARLVPAVCVHLTVLAVYFIGRRSVGERAATWAAVLLSVAPGYTAIARLILLDGLLTLNVTLSLLCGYEAVRTGTLKMKWWLAAAVASGLGFLTKGPISEILLFPPLFVAGWLTGTLAKVNLKNVLLFAAIVIAINMPWYIAIYLREPMFLKYFFWEHNVMRFVQPFDHLQPVWYYTPILLAGLLPGTVLFVPLARRLLGSADTRPLSPAGGFWLLAGAWCVAFFSVSGSKLPTYILPAYPLLCLALGEFVARGEWHYKARTKVIVGGMLIAMLVVVHVGVPWYAAARSPFQEPERVMPYLAGPGTHVVTYPRTCDSLAFYSGRHDFDRVRTKGVNQLMVDMHHRPRTVVLFTTRNSLAAFKEAMPPSLVVAEEVSFQRSATGVLGKLTGDTPWGLADIAVIRPKAVRVQD
jgi:4-amino-4-deoxy-L-arabinose transferase-like glycosyltransferase